MCMTCTWVQSAHILCNVYHLRSVNIWDSSHTHALYFTPSTNLCDPRAKICASSNFKQCFFFCCRTSFEMNLTSDNSTFPSQFDEELMKASESWWIFALFDFSSPLSWCIGAASVVKYWNVESLYFNLTLFAWRNKWFRKNPSFFIASFVSDFQDRPEKGTWK